MNFILLIIVKMPAIGDILTFMNTINDWLGNAIAETLKRVAILIMTNVIGQTADRIQKPPSGAGFFRGG